MKLKLLLIAYLLPMSATFSQESKTSNCTTKSFEVYIDDEDEFSNIREKPNGKVILKINNVAAYGYIMSVIDFKNGWLKINEINGIDDYTISNFEGWVHYSIAGIALTHSIDLLDKPNGKKVLKCEGETGETFKITDVYCEWVKIKTTKGSGWVKSENLCGNPVTTCP